VAPSSKFRHFWIHLHIKNIQEFIKIADREFMLHTISDRYSFATKEQIKDNLISAKKRYKTKKR
jgi:hypothetical protein